MEKKLGLLSRYENNHALLGKNLVKFIISRLYQFKKRALDLTNLALSIFTLSKIGKATCGT